MALVYTIIILNPYSHKIIMQLVANQYLTFERATPSESDLTEYWTEPCAVKDCLPQWYTDLPGNLKTLDLANDIEYQDILVNHGYRSAKLCMGLRGIRTVGWTIPLGYGINQFIGNLGVQGRKETMLHPAMITGSRFDRRLDNGRYEWEIRILSFPWRAKMQPGWRLMITAHPLTWSDEWFCFSGCVDANYRSDGRNIGHFWNFDYDIDPDYNYYNVEVVMALKSTFPIVPVGTCVFSMVPIYDPDYQVPEFKEFPNFN